jgi:hypothetical protein
MEQQSSNSGSNLIIKKTVKDEVKEIQKSKSDPKVWMLLSVAVAVFLSIANITISFISRHRFKARHLQSFGGVTGNLIAIGITSYKDKHRKTDKIDHKTGKKVQGSYFQWFKDAYIVVDRIEGKEQTTRIHWTRVSVSILLALQSTLQRYIFASAYYFASLADINHGVLTSINCMKPIFSSLIFYMLFSQSLRVFEMFAIFL